MQPWKLHEVYYAVLVIGFLAAIALPVAPVFDMPGLVTFHTVAKAIFILLDIVLLCIFAYALFKIIPYLPHFDFGRGPARKAGKDLRVRYFRERWDKIVKRYAAAPSADSIRLAVIEADALVDEALKDLGYPGETMAERLAPLDPQEMRSLDRLWDAHRLRNEIVHKPGAGLSIEKARAALADYEAFLKDLHLLS